MRALVIPLIALISATPAWAAGPSRQALNAAAEALYQDFGRDGVVGTQEQVRALYQEACDLGYQPACRSERWHDEHGLTNLRQAASEFANLCSRNDPVACMVEGWAIEAEPIGDNLKTAERADRQMSRLLRASEVYTTGCATQHWAPCLELAHYSSNRADLGQDEPDQIAAYERGARDVFAWYCRKGNQRACVFGAALGPQDPELLNKKGSAAFVYNDTCVNGYTPGCYELGLMLAPQKNESENRHWFDGLCDRGHAQSCLWVGRSHNDPTNEVAVDAYRRACKLQVAEGCAVAGPALEESAPAEALLAYRSGCAMDDGEACGRLGMLLVKSDQHATAVDFLDRGCAAGQLDTCITVGLMRREGVHVPSDPTRARVDLERGCASQGPRRGDACHALGSIYETGDGAVRDRSVAANFYHRACEAGKPESCFRVGESVSALQRGSQTAEMKAKALNGYVRACDSGIQEACLPAAEGYATGPVSIRDSSEAHERFQALCDAGDPVQSCLRFGQFLQSQSDTDGNLKAARAAFTRGRDLGDTEAGRQLAKMIYFGAGGPRSRRRANRMFRQACRDGNGLACGGIEQPGLARP